MSLSSAATPMATGQPCKGPETQACWPLEDSRGAGVAGEGEEGMTGTVAGTRRAGLWTILRTLVFPPTDTGRSRRF